MIVRARYFRASASVRLLLLCFGVALLLAYILFLPARVATSACARRRFAAHRLPHGGSRKLCRCLKQNCADSALQTLLTIERFNSALDRLGERLAARFQDDRDARSAHCIEFALSDSEKLRSFFCPRAFCSPLQGAAVFALCENAAARCVGLSARGALAESAGECFQAHLALADDKKCRRRKIWRVERLAATANFQRPQTLVV